MRKSTKRHERGFSLLELLIVIAVVLVLAGIAVPLTQSTVLNYRADAAMAALVSQLRTGREFAIANRRNVQVTFTQPNRIDLTVLYLPGEVAGPPIPPVILNGGMTGGATFATLGLQDLPNGFGNSSGINYQPSSASGGNLMFTSSGALVWTLQTTGLATVGNNNLANLSIFLGLTGRPGTGRAVSVFGGTGRVRTYFWTGSAWKQ
jgi:prepilin-type N-terminal cleavage/methylation domain-containing protein